jgi:hypothetical protein
MANQYVNKVVYGGDTLIDLTADTITADKLAKDVTAHDKSGAPITGTSTFDADTSDATATAAEILATKTAYVNGNKVTGSMPNRGAVTGTISTKAQQYTIQQGYHDGSGKVGISSTEQAKLIATNIRQGVTILGVEGSMSGTEDMDIEPAKSVTPKTTAQTILPAEGYDGMAQVNVAAIPVTRTDNAQGGVTVTIAAA